MLDLVEFQHFPYFAVHKGCVIVADNPIGYSKPHNYVFLDKVCYCSSYGFIEWYCLYLLNEVFHSH